MDLTFDIFRKLPDGKPVWVEAVEGLEEAKKRLTGLALISPEEYFIYSESKGIVVERVTKLQISDRAA